MTRLLLIAALFIGCTAQDDTRIILNQGSTAASLSDEINVTVRGASIISFDPRTDGDEAQVPLVKIRAQSLDVRLDVQISTCAPEAIHLTVTHMNTASTRGTMRTFLNGSDASTEATRIAGAGGFTLENDPHNPSWTPLAGEAPFELEATGSSPSQLNWTLCVDRLRRVSKILLGHTPRDTCDFPMPAGACAEPNPEATNDLRAAALVVRHRLKTDISDNYTFAVWGNNASNSEVQREIIDAVNNHDVRFAVISGDLTNDGTSASLKAAVNQLDSGLTVPWFATLGDRDVTGSAGREYIGMLGSSNFAFDAGPVRFAVIDSADRAIGDDARRQLRSWLGGASLGWEDPPASASVLITHVPPFDAYGTRDLALKDRSEAASISATLKRRDVAYTLTSQLGRYLVQSDGGVRVVHSGGGGGIMESTSEVPHHWLLVTVESPCDPETTGVSSCTAVDGVTTCVCLHLERKDL